MWNKLIIDYNQRGERKEREWKTTRKFDEFSV